MLGLYRDYIRVMWVVVKIMVPIRVILGLYGDNGKENGNYYSIIGYIWSKLWYPVG